MAKERQEANPLPAETLQAPVEFFARIREISVLNAAAESALFTTYQLGKAAESALTSKKRLSGEKREQLIMQVEEGIQAKQDLIIHNLRLVTTIARRSLVSGFDFYDALHDGVIGLNRAIEKFDLTRECRFSTFAWDEIRASIQRARRKSYPMSIPNLTYRKIESLIRADINLTGQLGRPPTVGELAASLKCGTSEVIELLKYRERQQIMSLDESASRDERQSPLVDMITGNSPSPEDIIIEMESLDAIKEEVKKKVKPILDQLSPTDREIITLLYGLEDGDRLSATAIAKELGLGVDDVRRTRNRVRHYFPRPGHGFVRKPTAIHSSIRNWDRNKLTRYNLALREIWSLLSPEQQKITRFLYGMETGVCLKEVAIAEIFGLTKQAISFQKRKIDKLLQVYWQGAVPPIE